MYTNYQIYTLTIFLETRAQFPQLVASRKLQKARLFLFLFQNVVIYKTTKLFKIYALRRVGEIKTKCDFSCKLQFFCELGILTERRFFFRSQILYLKLIELMFNRLDTSN